MTDNDIRVDVAIVGAGGAGVTLLHQLARHGPSGLSVAVLDPVDRLRERPADRTWCFWDDGVSEVEAAVHRSWRSALVVGPDGEHHRLDLTPLRYAMVRSEDLYAQVSELAAPLMAAHVPEPVTLVADGPEVATVVAGTTRVSASYVFDSRPAPPRRPARSRLLQHFHGELVHTASDCFDPDLPTLMDFRTPRPPSGLSFGYVLPTSARSALVEYTEFSPAALTDAAYHAACTGYADLATDGADREVVRAERGAIPMTDAVFARRVGRRVFRLGTAGGATRAATGYTFAAMLRQAGHVARALAQGAVPLPPRPYPRRHAYLDAVYLRALADGSLDGPRFFTDLFTGNPPHLVLRFLDGQAGPVGDLRVVASAPWSAMLRAAAGDLRARAGRTAYRAGRAGPRGG